MSADASHREWRQTMKGSATAGAGRAPGPIGNVWIVDPGTFGPRHGTAHGIKRLCRRAQAPAGLPGSLIAACGGGH